MLARVPEAVRLVEDLGLGDRLVAPATTQASVVLPDGRHPLPAGTVLGVPASADGLEGFLSPDGVARVRGRGRPPAAAAGRRRRRRRAAARAARRRGGRPAGRAAARRASTRAGPTSCRWPPPCRPWPPQLPATGSVLAAAAAARDAGARSRGDADGPVFATVADGIGSLPAALVAAARRRRSGCARRRTGCAGRRPASSSRSGRRRRRSCSPPTPFSSPRPRAEGRPAAGRRGARRGRAAAGHPVRVDGRGRDGLPGAGRRRRLGAARAAGHRAAGQGRHGVVGEVAAPRRGTRCWCASSVGRFRDESELQRSDDDLTARRRRRRRRPAGPGPARAAGDPAGALGRGPAAVPGRAIRRGWRRSGPPWPAVPGLAIAGAAFEGVGVPACIRDAYRAVDSLL